LNIANHLRVFRADALKRVPFAGLSGADSALDITLALDNLGTATTKNEDSVAQLTQSNKQIVGMNSALSQQNSRMS
jgi:hypothetical protein